MEPSQQGRVLFDGQRLDSKDILSDVGVTEGSQLNLVPGGSKSKKKKSSGAADASSGDAAAVADATESSPSSASNDPAQLAKEMLEQAGIDASQIDEMAKKMGLGGGEGGMPDMKESLDMMSKMTKSEVFQDYMKNPDRLEESRQMILNNPMMKSMMGSMPGKSFCEFHTKVTKESKICSHVDILDQGSSRSQTEGSFVSPLHDALPMNKFYYPSPFSSVFSIFFDFKNNQQWPVTNIYYAGQPLQ